MPECFIDTTLVSSLLDAKVSHKHSCNEVAKEMEKGKYRDAFAVGIIDNDKRKLAYIEGFEEIGRTENLTFLKHKDKHQYVIKVGKDSKAMRTSQAAHPQMREIAVPLLKEFQKLIPVVFDDIEF